MKPETYLILQIEAQNVPLQPMSIMHLYTSDGITVLDSFTEEPR